MAEKITMGSNGVLSVPGNPIIPFIEGDGIGPEIWQVAQKVFDAAVKGLQRHLQIEWKEMLAGEKAFKLTAIATVAETLQTAKEFIVSIKGLLTTPIGGGIRS
ncbi:MAG: isocitrate/isopropylmalate family dehydrogenase [Ferruginibacter sp.]